MKRALLLGTLVSVVLLPAQSAKAGGGGGCYQDPSDGRSTTVVLLDYCFAPTVARVEPGDTVIFENREEFADHVIIGASARWGGYRMLHPGKARSFQFDAEGVYPYFCFLHPGMAGAVVVGDGAGAGSGDVYEVGSNLTASPPPVTYEPLIFHIPKPVEATAERSVAGTAGLVWGGAAAGFIGGLAVLWATRRSDRREP